MASSKKRRISNVDPITFARRTARYFRACDTGCASGACQTCAHSFGSDECESCSKKQARPYTLSGLCLALGLSKRQFLSLREDPDFTEAVERTLLKIEAYVEENSLSGKINGTLAQTILRENFGWGEKNGASDRISVVLSEGADELAR